MQRISTPTAVPDKFGAGKNGFTDTPPNQTQLEASWFDAVQEEIARAIEFGGTVLDPLNLGQLGEAINSWTWSGSGTPTVGTGVVFTIESGGTLLAEAGSIVTINTTADFNGDVNIGDGAGDTLTVDAVEVHQRQSTFNDTVILNGIATLNAGATLADAQTIAGATANTTVQVGTVDTVDANGVVATGELQFYSDATPSSATGVMQFGGRFLTIGLNSVARKVSVPYESHVPGPVSTVNSIADTGASIAIVLSSGDTVRVTMDYEAKQTATANNVNVRIEVNGTPTGSTEQHAPVKANIYFTVRRVIEYTAPSTNLYTFVARFGASAGTTTVQNVNLMLRHV